MTVRFGVAFGDVNSTSEAIGKDSAVPFAYWNFGPLESFAREHDCLGREQRHRWSKSVGTEKVSQALPAWVHFGGPRLARRLQLPHILELNTSRPRGSSAFSMGDSQKRSGNLSKLSLLRKNLLGLIRPIRSTSTFRRSSMEKSGMLCGRPGSSSERWNIWR